MLTRAVDDPDESGAALIGGQGLTGGGIDGQGVAPLVDGRAAGEEGDGLGRPAVIGGAAETGSAMPTWLPLVPSVKPPEPPVPIRLYGLAEATVPSMSSAVTPLVDAVGVQCDDRVVQADRSGADIQPFDIQPAAYGGGRK